MSVNTLIEAVQQGTSGLKRYSHNSRKWRDIQNQSRRPVSDNLPLRWTDGCLKLKQPWDPSTPTYTVSWRSIVEDHGSHLFDAEQGWEGLPCYPARYTAMETCNAIWCLSRGSCRNPLASIAFLQRFEFSSTRKSNMFAQDRILQGVFH